MALSVESRSTILDNLYPPEGAHGKPHAEQVYDNCLEIANSSFYHGKLTNRDQTLLSLSALGHDAGYPEWKPYWSGIQFEHAFSSSQRMDSVLKQLPDITKEETLLVQLLIINHDNTNYIFPAWEFFESKRRGMHIPQYGRPEMGPATINPHPGLLLGEQHQLLYSDRFRTMLSILQEADSRCGDAKRTLTFARSRHIPQVEEHSHILGIGMPMWQFSGCASALLAAQRALLDARTPEGQEIAWKLFKETREIIQETIFKESESVKMDIGNQVILDEDNVGELLREVDVRNLIFKYSSLERLQKSYPLVMLEQAYPLQSIDQVPETGIVENENAASILVDVSKLTSKKPETGNRLKWLGFIREAVIANFGMDLLTTMPGAVKLSLNQGTFMQAQNNSPFTYYPPIITMPSLKFTPEMLRKQKYTIARGDDWVNLAQQIGLKKIRVIFNKDLSN